MNGKRIEVFIPGIVFIIAALYTQLLTAGSIEKYIMNAAWILLISASIYNSSGKLVRTSQLLCFAQLVFIILFISIVSSDHVATFMIRNVMISFGSYIIGIGLVRGGITRDKFIKMMMISIVGVILLERNIINEYIGTIADFMQQTSVYMKKNTAGQLVAISVIFIYVISKKYKFSRLENILKPILFVAAIGLTFGLFLIQARTSIIALAISITLLIVRERRGKWKLFVLGIIIITIVMTNDQLLSIFLTSFELNNIYKTADIDTFSSGRLVYYQAALKMIDSHPFIGVGRHYVDNLYLQFGIEYGWIGLLSFLIMYINRIISNFKVVDLNEVKDDFMAGLTIGIMAFYFIVGFAEAFPPFGPGVCTFWFWFISGYRDSLYYESESEISR